jgi:hypothetical protein
MGSAPFEAEPREQEADGLEEGRQQRVSTPRRWCAGS